MDEDGEARSLCEAPRLEGKTDKLSQRHGRGRGTGPLCVPDTLPPAPVPGVRVSLSPGQKQQREEKVLSSGGPRFALKDSSLGCPGPVFRLISRTYLTLLGKKERLACCLVLAVDLLLLYSREQRAVPGSWGSEMNKDSFCLPEPPAWQGPGPQAAGGTRGLGGGHR